MRRRKGFRTRAEEGYNKKKPTTTSGPSILSSLRVVVLHPLLSPPPSLSYFLPAYHLPSPTHTHTHTRPETHAQVSGWCEKSCLPWSSWSRAAYSHGLPPICSALSHVPLLPFPFHTGTLSPALFLFRPVALFNCQEGRRRSRGRRWRWRRRLTVASPAVSNADFLFWPLACFIVCCLSPRIRLPCTHPSSTHSSALLHPVDLPWSSFFSRSPFFAFFWVAAPHDSRPLLFAYSLWSHLAVSSLTKKGTGVVRFRR